MSGDLFKLVEVISNAAPATAECKRWSDNNRKPRFFRETNCVFHVGGYHALGYAKIDFNHCTPEELSVFRNFDSIYARSEELDTMLF